MSEADPRSVYVERVSACERGLARLRKIETACAAVKLGLAAAGAVFFVRAATAYSPGRLAAVVAAVLAFAAAAVVHESFLGKSRALRLLREVNADELAALDGGFPARDDGARYQDADHPFALDLDLFGPRSVFQALNRTSTRMGADRLAAWLAADAPEAAAIEARQAAAAELRPLVDLRQAVQIHGRELESGAESRAKLAEFLSESPSLLGRRGTILLIFALPLAVLAAAGLAVSGLPWPVVLVPIGANIILNRVWRRRTNRVYALTSRSAPVLAAYARIVGDLEGADFRSPLLTALRGTLRDATGPASVSIRRLASRLGWFDVRQSPLFYVLANALALWDLHCLRAIESWLRGAAARVPGWFEAMADFEALSSLAASAFNHPAWAVPRIAADGPVLDAAGLGHPLIPEASRVANDLRIERPGDILIVTGPNMAGKSTFLKTVGVAAVLAFAGAPVCAGRISLRPFRLRTSMKISDSLDKSLSLFYAELLRLKMVLDAVSGGAPVVFLLDEILKGTNALDRQKGALALLRQLAGRSTGVVATHDLELTKLDESFPGRIANAHFDGTVEGDRLRFDFKLRGGPCLSFNALVLMRRIGIEI